MDAAGLIVAAGRGERLGAALPKCFLPLAGAPLFLHSVRAFLACPQISRLALLVPPGWEDAARSLLAGLPSPPLVLPGGASRPLSVRAGLTALAESPPDYVAIHDGARPFLRPELISRTLDLARETGAALAAAPLTDTLKRASAPDLRVLETPPRRDLWRAQTPQTFRFSLLWEAYRHCAATGEETTDDAMLVERLGSPVSLCPVEDYNEKITTREDLERAEALLRPASDLRVGHGYDLHRLVEGRPLRLGGVQIPHPRGLLGHSDGDAACHALADALLGALALGDIGHHFPDTDPQYAGADSTVLLAQVGKMLRARGGAPLNCDLTIQAQEPRLAPYLEEMRARLAAALELPVENVSVKATTTEGLGPIGAGEALAVHALALVRVPCPLPPDPGD